MVLKNGQIVHFTNPMRPTKIMVAVPNEVCAINRMCDPTHSYCYNFTSNEKCKYAGVVHLTNGIENNSKCQVECNVIDAMKK